MSSLFKRVSWLAALFIVGGIGYFALSHYASTQTVQIKFPVNANLKASIYRVPEQDKTASQDNLTIAKNLVKEVTSDQAVKLKKGDYILVTNSSGDYAVQVTNFSLNESPTTVTVDPAYTDKKLATLLAADSSALHALIARSLPTANFTVSGGHLYRHGEWYGTTLVPAQTDEQRRLGYSDTYRLVAHKENGTWKLVTLPPELILSHITYPDVPRDVLVEVNKQQ